VLLRLGKWLVVLALVVSTGAHWLALQSVAWATMAVRFSQTDTVAVALEKTFNGQNPCDLCKAVAEGQKNERKEAVLKLDVKLELLLQASPIVVLRPPAAVQTPTPVPTFFARTEAPPTPPPRLA